MMDIMDTESRYFVKSNKTMAEVSNVFGNVTFADDSVDGNLAYITEKMTEREFLAKIGDEHFIRVLEA
jgi:homoserine dehydrogenase